ncbi:hypothetical protein ACP4OV_018426 [Aristida adscensionis]
MASPDRVSGALEHSIDMPNDELGRERRVVKAEKELNNIVFGVALLEWAGNAAGTLASLWATVVLLGGYCTLLNSMDFWFSTVMIFIEASRVFIRNDALVNRWLFGSTRAFRSEDFSFARMSWWESKRGSIKAVAVGVSIKLIPMIGPEIVVGVLKTALLIIISQFLAWRPKMGDAAVVILFELAVCARLLYNGFAVVVGEKISTRRITNPIALLCFEVITAACLACLPFLQAIMHPYYYTYFSITAASMLVLLGFGDPLDETEHPRSPIFQILDTIQPLLVLWALMYPLPGISLKTSFYILFPALVAAVTRNLQIPMQEVKVQEVKVIRSSLNFVRSLATTGGQIGATFLQELWENPSLLDSIESILDLEHSQQKLWEPVMDVIAKLALNEDARQVIGSTQGIICRLMHAFLKPHDLGPSEDNYHSLQLAAGEALANLSVMNKDNCWAILEEPGYDNLIKDLIDMLDNGYAYVAGNLLYNLCADHSRDKLIGLASAKQHLESAMQEVMNSIKTKEGEQLEAVLSVTSQIGYLIPQHFAKVLESDTFRAELVKKLDMKPCPKYPRMRRLLVEMVISIIENAKLCPGCINSFIEQGVMDALEKVKRTPSRLEKYRVFFDGEGVVVERLSMCDLVDKAKKLIHQATTPEGKPEVHT